MKTKYKIKVAVMGYVEKEVISNSLDEAIKEINSGTITPYEFEQNEKLKVLDYYTTHKLYEVIEELPINRYDVTIPITGYYNTTIEAFSKEEAINLAMNSDETRDKLKDYCNYKDISYLDTDDTAMCDISCELVTS